MFPRQRLSQRADTGERRWCAGSGGKGGQLTPGRESTAPLSRPGHDRVTVLQ